MEEWRKADQAVAAWLKGWCKLREEQWEHIHHNETVQFLVADILIDWINEPGMTDKEFRRHLKGLLAGIYVLAQDRPRL